MAVPMRNVFPSTSNAKVRCAVSLPRDELVPPNSISTLPKKPKTFGKGIPSTPGTKRLLW